MTPRKKATELVFTFGSIKLALEAVKQIEDALLFGLGLQGSENIEDEFRFWGEVRDEINKLNIGL